MTSPKTKHWGYADHTSLDKLALVGKVSNMMPDPSMSVPVMGITGSHSWHLAHEDSDIDVRGIYVKPTGQILSLRKGRDTIERIGEVDIQFYEIEKAMGMMMSHNGNIIELLLSPSVFYVTGEGLALQAVAKKYLTKELFNYYRGYATSQRKRAAQNRGGKALVYTYREIYAGIWLMHAGYIEYDFRTLWENIERDIYHSKFLPEVFDRPKWRVVPFDEWDLFMQEWEELCAILGTETEHSSLPETYNGYDELNELLLTVRRKYDHR